MQYDARTETAAQEEKPTVSVASETWIIAVEWQLDVWMDLQLSVRAAVSSP